jgi:hypothetical protein
MPTRLHIPKDWKLKTTRALSNLNEPVVEAACFWCGHQYRQHRRGEYSVETESAHLLQRLEYTPIFTSDGSGQYATGPREALLG